MKATRTTCFAAGLSLAVASAMANAAVLSVFINEFHYDNAGTDAGEFVEIAGPAGTDLAGYSLLFYNGASGAPYETRALAGILPDQQNGFGTAVVMLPGIQNGSPDGFALASGAAVLQFLSYEGSFAATTGAASGLASTDIGLSEPADNPIGYSLQLQGSGQLYEDFVWANAPQATPGNVNGGQFFTRTIPEPGTSALFLAGLGLLGFAGRRRQRKFGL